MTEKKKYIYCNVLPADRQSPCYYLCDFDVKAKDIVIIPLGYDNEEKVGLVIEVEVCTETTAPYPIECTKHISRAFGANETPSLREEKAKVEAEAATWFKSEEVLEKITIRENLIGYGVGKRERNSAKAQMMKLLEQTPCKDGTIEACITDLSDGVILSADGKTVTGFQQNKKKKYTVIHIPSGVETIEDYAFLKVEIDRLFLPKELKHLGKYTLNGQCGYNLKETYPKKVDRIEVEEGNEYFTSDEIGFYSVEDGKKKLIRMLDKNLSTYVVPFDVNAFAEGCFEDCWALRHIVLNEGMEIFDEYALPDNTLVEEIFIPKTVKHLRTKSLALIDRYADSYAERNTVIYQIDEESDYLFRDEDSIYEVLDDGSYKLVACFYTGKGRTLFLKGTSVIGAHAFEGHKNITKIEFPASIKVIEEYAFAGTGLKNLKIPNHIQRIEAEAFSRCNDLLTVQLGANIEYIAENAFMSCRGLNEIVSENSEKVFFYKNGIVRKLAESFDKTEEAMRVPTALDKENFAKLAPKIVQVLMEVLGCHTAKFDERDGVISVTDSLSQYSRNLNLVKERVDCAETLKENDPVKIMLKNGYWEVTSIDGKSLGILFGLMDREILPYLCLLSIHDVAIESITPKSKRRANSKYAQVTVRFNITNRQITGKVSQQTLLERRRFAYYVDIQGVNLFEWIEPGECKTAVIPSSVEDKPVISVSPWLFRTALPGECDQTVENIVFSEGIKRLEAGSLSYFPVDAPNIKKIVLPSSIEYISPDVFRNEDGWCQDFYVHKKTSFVVPAGSYAEKFLKSYRFEMLYNGVLAIVHENDCEEV